GPSAHAKIIGLHVRRPLSVRNLGFRQPPYERLDDPGRDLILDGENVFQRTIEPFRPYMTACDGIDQLHIDSNASRGSSGAAFEDITDTEIARDAANIDRLSLVGE